MATSYTSLLGFALPVTGELDGTWGTTVNDSITELVEDAIAATATQSVAGGDWTLTTTGSGAANQARCAIIIPTGSPGVSRNVIVPSQSKAYIVVNQSDAAVVVKGSATTGVTLVAGDKALVAWNGSDFVRVGASAGGSNTQVQFNDNGSLGGSANLTWNGSTLTTVGTTTVRAAATQDAVTIAGRAGGTSSYAVTLTPTTLSASRTVTLPDATTTMAGTDATQTLTNKRIDPRVASAASASSVTPDVSTIDVYAYTALAADLTINAPIGTPVDGNKLTFRILDNGTPRALTWNGTFTAIGVTIPTTTVANKMIYVGTIYNAANTRWDVVAVATQA